MADAEASKANEIASGVVSREQQESTVERIDRTKFAITVNPDIESSTTDVRIKVANYGNQDTGQVAVYLNGVRTNSGLPIVLKKGVKACRAFETTLVVSGDPDVLDESYLLVSDLDSRSWRIQHAAQVPTEYSGEVVDRLPREWKSRVINAGRPSRVGLDERSCQN